MRSRIFVFYIALFLGCVAAAPAAAQDPDALYRARTDLAQAKAAADIWQARITADPNDFESAWKLARAAYWLGGHGPTDARRSALEHGVAAGTRAVALAPMKPEGHFWMAASMGALAESYGIRQGLKYRGAIRDALETVLRIDPAFQQGSADRALGRWYFKVPALFGGSMRKSEEHLRRSLTFAPYSIVSHVFLADTLFERDRDDEARQELRAAIAAPLAAGWEPEDREFKALAERRLAR